METRSQSLEGFTEDLIIEILIWLPLFSILRFRCVCKSWYNLLDVNFINTKLKNSKLLIRKQDPVNQKYNVEFISNENAVNIVYPFEKPYGGIQILGSCNGLIYACYAGYVCYVWNPYTKEYKVILAGVKDFDRYITSINHGFGYDSKTCDYKFVRIFGESYTAGRSSRVEVYSLDSDPWKTRRYSIPYKISRVEPGVLLNGALHWLATSQRSQQEVILSFNLEEERSKEIPLPDEPMDYFDYKFVDVLRGYLCLLCSVSNVKFEIWEMKEYGVRESWSKLFQTDMQQLMTMGIGFCQYIRRAVYSQSGQILLEVHDQRWAVDVVRIELEEKKGYAYMKNIIQIVPYNESLVSVNSGTHVGVVQERKDYYESLISRV